MPCTRPPIFSAHNIDCAMTEPIQYELDARGVATLTFNRPEKGNACNTAMLTTLHERLAALENDPRCRSLVLRGNGRHFSVGADVSEPIAHGPGERLSLPGIIGQIDAFPKPTIAAVQGACVGGGLAFAAVCDVVFAAHDAFFAIPELRLGMSLGALGLVFARAIGLRNLHRYGLSGERFSAYDAHRFGLAHELCAQSEFDERIATIADHLLHAPPGATKQAKVELQRMRAVDPALQDWLVAGFNKQLASPEVAEGRAAFREKRKASWVPPPK